MQFIHRNGCACHLHQGQDIFLHTGATTGGDHDKRLALFDGVFHAGHDAVARRAPHGPHHKIPVQYANRCCNTANGAVGGGDGIAVTGIVARIGQTVFVRDAVNKVQRVVGHRRQCDAFPRVVVEQQVEPLFRCHDKGAVATRANIVIVFVIFVINQAPTGFTFNPHQTTHAVVSVTVTVFDSRFFTKQHVFYPFIFFVNSRLGLNKMVVPASRCIGWPVHGLYPILDARIRGWNVPNPRISIRSPLATDSIRCSTTVSTIAAASDARMCLNWTCIDRTISERFICIPLFVFFLLSSLCPYIIIVFGHFIKNKVYRPRFPHGKSIL